jgi:hypothetical protein
MLKKTVKPYAAFTLLPLILFLMFSMVTLPTANAVNPYDDDRAGEKNGQTSTAGGDQANLCDDSDGPCTQANVDQYASGSHNKAFGFNDQSGTAAPAGDRNAAAGNFTDVLMKIDGIDYSTVKVKVWIAADNGREVSKTFNPVPLLNPEDDDRGLILVPMKVEKGLLDIGDTYTGCIKVIEDTDKYGNKQSCQQNVLRLEGDEETANSISPASTAPAADAADDGVRGGGGSDGFASSGSNGGGVAVMRISL